MDTSQAIILSYTPEPEKIIGSAARISTTEGTAIGIYEKTDKSNTEKLIPRVIKLGHTSTIEHMYLNIAFENVSVFVEQFIIEFRLASFTVKSRRYVDFSKMGYYSPEFRSKEGTKADADIQNEFDEHVKKLFSSYEDFIAAGIPKEDARFILPYCFRSNFYCSVNARELVHIIFACLKGRGRSYPELVNLGQSLLSQAGKIIPAIFDNFNNLEKGSEQKEEELAELLGDMQVETKQPEILCELISHTPSPHKLVGIAALLKHKSMSTKQASQLADDKELLTKILKIVINDKRSRELEQINFTFSLPNLTLASLTHLVRHRIQSINIPSFTEAKKSSRCIIPDSVKANKTVLAVYEELIKTNNALYEKMLSEGIMEEDLVYLYLAGNKIDVVTTINGRELLHFMKLRTCSRAQWEIRIVAVEMLKKLREVSPELYKYYGPSCYVTGTCPEGKMSCGRKKEICDYFKGIL